MSLKFVRQIETAAVTDWSNDYLADREFTGVIALCYFLPLAIRFSLLRGTVVASRAYTVNCARGCQALILLVRSEFQFFHALKFSHSGRFSRSRHSRDSSAISFFVASDISGSSSRNTEKFNDQHTTRFLLG